MVFPCLGALARVVRGSGSGSGSEGGLTMLRRCWGSSEGGMLAYCWNQVWRAGESLGWGLYHGTECSSVMMVLMLMMERGMMKLKSKAVVVMRVSKAAAC